MKSPQPAQSLPRILRYDAWAVVDARGTHASPGSILVEFGGGAGGGPGGEIGDAAGGFEPLAHVLAVGSAGEVDRHPAAAGAQAISLPHSVLLPGLVNAHAHLDLTHIGPRPHDPAAGFVAWVEMIRTGRHIRDDLIAGSVRQGAERSLMGGTVAIGDIAGAPLGQPRLAPWRALAQTGLIGASYLEFFGMGAGREPSRQRVEAALKEVAGEVERDGVRLGLQPHAPNTVDLRLYEWAVERARALGLPLATHLAETMEERRFVMEGAGPQREFLERLGLWDASVLDHIGRGVAPVEHLEPVLAAGRFVVAHVNDADDAAIERLAGTGTSVAYCPRASTYFGAERVFGPHRYRDMLEAGVNVALGTDSIVNLPAADVERCGISVLDDMRLLWRRDKTDPCVLLAMATVNGARALGLPESWFSLGQPGRLAGLVAVRVETTPRDEDPVTRALESASPGKLLFGAKFSCQTGNVPEGGS